jgi:putative oxidoreductase
MAVAYFQFHVVGTGQLLPIQNGGELAVLYCFVFLMVFARGAGSISLDRSLGRA